MKRIFKWIIGLFKKKDVVEYQWGEINREEQTQELHVYINDEFHHTITLHYFTEDQFKLITESQTESKKL